MLVGVTGRAQHGKDSVGKFLVDNFGFTRFAFADTLKSMALALNPFILGVDPDQGHLFTYEDEHEAYATLSSIVRECGWEVAKSVPEVRRFLQVLGTEAVRDHLGEDTWVNAMDLKLRKFGTWTFGSNVASSTYDTPDVVITDVRFPNEAAYIKAAGGMLFRATRRDFDNGLPAEHPSEALVSELRVDYDVVVPSGRLDLLFFEVANLLDLPVSTDSLFATVRSILGPDWPSQKELVEMSAEALRVLMKGAAPYEAQQLAGRDDV